MDDKFELFYKELQTLLTSRQLGAKEMADYMQFIESSRNES